MEHLRLFENYKSDEEIHKICRDYFIRNYTINKDGSIDVDGDLTLSLFRLTELPLVFNKINGNFDCGNNRLTTLKGSPKIVNGNFVCSYNRFLNLIGGPEEVSGAYHCHTSKLTSLEGIAKIISGSLYIYNTKLNTLSDIPEDFYVGGTILFYKTPIYDKLEDYLSREYKINLNNIKDKYLDLFLDINDLDAIQDGEIVDIRMDEVLYNIGLI